MKTLNSLLIGLLLAIPGLAAAEQGDLPTKTSGPYLGIGGGYSTIDTQDTNISVSGEDFSYRGFGGYRFAQLPLPFNIDLGIEAGYVDFGKISELTAGADVEVELTGIEAAGIVYLPINRHFDVFGKAGVYFWDGKVKADGIKTSDQSNTDLLLGLGVAWQTGTPFGAQLEVEALDALDGVWVATLSATYQFK